MRMCLNAGLQNKKNTNVLQWCPPDLGYLSGLQMHQFMLAGLGSGLSQHGRPGILPQLRAITGEVILVE